MHIRAIPIGTAASQLHRKRRVWPPTSLKEPTNAVRVAPRRWQQPRLWLAANLWCAVVVLVMSTIAQPAAAQQTADVTSGTLLFESAEGRIEAPRVHTAVDMQVSGILARIQVRQQFHNPSEQWVEGVYAFPLPENSAVNELQMQIGERVIVGEVREKLDAQQLFEQAKNNGQRATVVHQERPNIFRTAVANIGPQQTIHITVTYLQIVDQQAGRYSLRFPLTITPRYGPGVPVQRAVLPSWEAPIMWRTAAPDSHDTATFADLQPTFAHADLSRQSVSFAITLNAGTQIENISSAYHPIDIDSSGAVYRVKLSAESIAPDRDFEIAWTPIVLGGPATALFREQTHSGEHVLLMFMPPQDQTPVAAAREVFFIIDTSGSMAGDSIEQARAALLNGLKTLQPADRFNVILFNSTFETLFDAPVSASADSVERANRYVRGLRANGGTEMLAALTAAFSMYRSTEHLQQIVFITDGAVSNEVELMQAIKAGIGDGRLFIVGIGAAPNAHFMRTAAQAGRGTFTFIGSGNEVEQKMGELFHKLTHPVLADIEVRWPGGTVPEYAPAQIGDLYADEPIVMSARLTAKARGVVTITGHADGVWTRQLSLDSATSSPGVATLWARNRIADLMALQTVHVDDADIRAQVLPLALEYQLVSKYTSLIAVDKTPVRQPEEALHSARIDNTKPNGSQWNASGLPQTATPAQLQLSIGALLLLLAATMKVLTVKRQTSRT
jgi:Ca-activated chloride channel family protein